MPRFIDSFFRCSLLLLVCASWSACSRKEDAERVFEVHGIVRGTFDNTDGTLSIEHEAIPGYMPAMTMPFNTTQADVASLTPGDRVVFEFRVGEKSRATKFRKLGRAADNAAGRELGGQASAARTRRLKQGDAVPAFALVNQDGRAVTTETLDGRHTVLTFVFTRCPVPEFCPLIGRKFKALQEGLAKPPVLPASEVQLLSITIDPEYDRPEILRAYGESLGADFGRWQFATGDTGEVGKLARLFAVRTERNGATLDHTLATALIGPGGEVIEIWRGNAWTPEEVLTRIRAAAGR